MRPPRRATDPSPPRRAARRRTAGGLAGALLLGLALPGAAAAQVAPGYILNPAGIDTTRQVDPYGMSFLTTARYRTPTGFLYPDPLEPETLSEFVEGWLGRAAIGIGGEGAFGDTDETRFSKYADWSKEFLLNSFSVGLLNPERGFHFAARGGGVGRKDDYYSGEIGWQERVRLRGTWSGIPHTYARDARNLFQGAGSEVLTIPDPPLTPGDNDDAAVADALIGIGDSTLATQRNDLGLFLDLRMRPDLKLFASYQRKARKGERPFGGSLIYATGLSGGLARAIETTQPIDDETHLLSSGVEYERGRFLGRLSFNGSLYMNHDETLTWDNPFQVSTRPGRGSANVERGRFAMAPDNSWTNLKSDLTVHLPLDGRFTTTLSWSNMHQDETLLPPTVNSGIVGGGSNQVNLDLWNTQASVAGKGGNANVYTFLANADLRLRPWRKLRLGARFRYYDRSNDTDYTAFNPFTGQIGYVAEDGALAVGSGFNRTFEPGRPTDDWRYRSTPYGYDEIKAEGRVDYALQSKTSVGLRYTWQRIGYDHRERKRTEENRVRADLKSRQISWATVRLSYEYGDRTGSPYDPDPYGAYFVSSLPGYTPLNPNQPYTLDSLRKYDLAGRQQHLADLRVNFLVAESMDLALVGSYRDNDYRAADGLDYDRRGSVSLEWGLQPSPKLRLFLSGTYGQGQRKMRNINDLGFDSFPPENAWSERTHETTGAAMASLWVRPWERVSLETSYNFIFSEQRLHYDYNSAGALPPGTTPAEAGNAFPDLETEDQVLLTSLRVELTEKVAVKGFYRFELSTIHDFQQRGLEAGVIQGAYYLGHVDGDYQAHVVGGTLQLRF